MSRNALMKYNLLFFLLVVSVSCFAQDTVEKVVINYNQKKTEVLTNANGELIVNVSQKDVQKFKSNGRVQYNDFGAKADGKTDDINVIAATHAFANAQGLPVKANEGATYYIGGKKRIAEIQTNTDFGNAKFIIDDTEVEDRTAHVFVVTSNLVQYKPEGITSLSRNQAKLNKNFPTASIITVVDTTIRRYIRFGPNQNNGSPQTDIFIVDKDGNVDMNAPIVWDFHQITDIKAMPIDETTLIISGGRFTTIANKAESKYNYYARGIAVRRSNVLVEGLEHRITGEGDHGAPYNGFLNIADCSNVTVKNCLLTGHKTYETIGSAGVKVLMGTYDIIVNRALNVSFIDCRQTNDINDSNYWGIMGSNYSKNLLYDNCTFSRFDAHMGVANGTIRNSTLGHQGINAIGSGTFIVENCTVRGRNFINLRSDYGSTWQGEFIIKNCTFVPSGGKPVTASLIGGSNSGKHNFGYTCTMPEKITIDGLHIDDSSHPSSYNGPAIFANFNPDMIDESYVEEFPYVINKGLLLKNVTVASGKPLRLSDNKFMFRDVKIESSTPVQK